MPPTIALAEPPVAQRRAQVVVRAVVAVPGLRRALLSPVIARPGYWLASAAGWSWGGILSRRLPRESHGVYVARGCPAWAYGRGGTTLGAVYLTRDNDSPEVLEHEAVHRAQWRHYGLAFIVLYLAAGPDAMHNRFEIAAGLEKGGYR